jgi:hypothetical protein
LTRVALPEGSLIVNSSQGGGSKDTWVLSDESDRAGSRDAAGSDVADPRFRAPVVGSVALPPTDAPRSAQSGQQ